MAIFAGKRWQKIETYTLVSMLTVLVWLYAEAETVKPNSLPIQISFSGSGSQLISPSHPEAVSATFRCTTAQLAALRALRDRDVPFEIDVTARDDGMNQIDVKQGLEHHPRIAALGVVVDRVHPPELTVQIERLVDEKLAVEFDPQQRELENDAVVDPAEITVTMPSSLKQILAENNVTTLKARLDEERFAEVPEGVPTPLQDVRIVIPPVLQAEHVSLSETSVTVTLTILRQWVEEHRWPVPIRYQLPPGAHRFRITLSEGEDTTKVNLKGPPEVIDRIKRYKLPTLAILEFTLTELEEAATRTDPGEALSKPAVLHLPPKVIAFPSTPRIEYTVEKIEG